MNSSGASVNETHLPELQSWVESANTAGTDFPIQNLPLGVFRRRYSDESFRCGVAIGDFIVDVSQVCDLFFDSAKTAASSCQDRHLNSLMALGAEAAAAFRWRLSHLLGTSATAHERERVGSALVAMDSAEMASPVRVAGFTDFFASVHHATNAGRLFRADNPLLPNYKYVPIAYNGRANSVRTAPQVRRPSGQIRIPEQEAPVFGPSKRLDYEVELGIFIGVPSQLGHPVPAATGWEHVFGFCLLNDWSARDIQSWEYQPLGPFLAKSFATSISPWVVTAGAVAPFRCQAAVRPEGDPAPLPYLHDPVDQQMGGVSIVIEAHLCSARMRADRLPPVRMSRSDASTLYWTISQMVTHHTSNGSALDTGDLFGSGTISGPSSGALGSLLEITHGGVNAFTLPSGEQRAFLADGDEVILSGYCERRGFRRIGFGECRATIVQA